MEILNELQLNKLIKLEKDKLVIRTDINDETLGRFLSYYDFLTNNIIDLMERVDKDTILYSKYYWYTKYKKRYFEVFGYDAGIEQQEFMLLEELENELESGIDWGIIKNIEEIE